MGSHIAWIAPRGIFVWFGGFTKDAQLEARAQEQRRVTSLGFTHCNLVFETLSLVTALPFSITPNLLAAIFR